VKRLLTIYDWVLGIAEISAVILSIIAGIIAITMFRQAREHGHLRSWKWLIGALFFFIAVETVAALKAFGIYSVTWETHVLASIILVFLITALTQQIAITKGYDT